MNVINSSFTESNCNTTTSSATTLSNKFRLIVCKSCLQDNSVQIFEKYHIEMKLHIKWSSRVYFFVGNSVSINKSSLSELLGLLTVTDSSQLSCYIYIYIIFHCTKAAAYAYNIVTNSYHAATFKTLVLSVNVFQFSPNLLCMTFTWKWNYLGGKTNKFQNCFSPWISWSP